MKSKKIVLHAILATVSLACIFVIAESFLNAQVSHIPINNGLLVFTVSIIYCIAILVLVVVTKTKTYFVHLAYSVFATITISICSHDIVAWQDSINVDKVNSIVEQSLSGSEIMLRLDSYWLGLTSYEFQFDMNNDNIEAVSFFGPRGFRHEYNFQEQEWYKYD